MDYQLDVREDHIEVYKVTCNSERAKEVLQEVMQKTNLVIKLAENKYLYAKEHLGAVSAAIGEVVLNHSKAASDANASFATKKDVGVQTAAAATNGPKSGIKSKIPIRVPKRSKPPEAKVASQSSKLGQKLRRVNEQKENRPSVRVLAKQSRHKCLQVQQIPALEPIPENGENRRLTFVIRRHAPGKENVPAV